MSTCKIKDCDNIAEYGELKFMASRCEEHRNRNMVKNPNHVCDICKLSNKNIVATYIQYNDDDNKIEFRCDIHIDRDINIERSQNERKTIIYMIIHSKEKKETGNQHENSGIKRKRDYDEGEDTYISARKVKIYNKKITQTYNMNLYSFMNLYEDQMEIYELLKSIDEESVDINSKIYKDFINLSNDEQNIIRDNNYYGKFEVNEDYIKELYKVYFKSKNKALCMAENCSTRKHYGVYSLNQIYCNKHALSDPVLKDILFVDPRLKCSFFKICKECETLERCQSCIRKESTKKTIKYIHRCTKCPKCDNCKMCVYKFGLYKMSYPIKNHLYYMCRSCSNRSELYLPRESITGKPIKV